MSMTIEMRLQVGQREAEAVGRRLRDEDIFASMHAVADKYGKCTVPNYAQAYKDKFVSITPRGILLTFGTWNEALEAAGLPVVRRRSQYSNHRTEKSLIDDVRACRDALGRIPSIAEYGEWRKPPRACSATIRGRLGGWRVVIEELMKEER